MAVGEHTNSEKLASWDAVGSDDYDFTLVIACFCEEPHLFSNIVRLVQYFSSLKFKTEFIFIEDASPDNTVREMLRCVDALKHHNISFQMLRHKLNCGRGATVQQGFEMARGEFVGFIDVDLEHPMDALLPMLLSLKNDECDAIVAHRIPNKKMISPLRSWMSQTYRALVHFVLPLPVADTEAGLKLFRRSKLLPVLSKIKDTQWFWDTEIVHQCALHELRFREHMIVFTRNVLKQSTVKVFRDSWIYLKTLYRYVRRQRAQ